MLVAGGEVTGLIDWGNVMFTHPEYDVAISHMIMSIGPLYLDGNLPQRDDLRAAVEWAMASTWQRTERNVRSMTAFSSITVRCVRHMPTR
ncbi:MAG: aminoglycoside phosphotransferase family protein, partial [Dehalococcoidia bacterium]|nr:aminoglycoside phosphotransferase family protein [Dehalococcoidia bacterium]